MGFDGLCLRSSKMGKGSKFEGFESEMVPICSTVNLASDMSRRALYDIEMT